MSDSSENIGFVAPQITDLAPLFPGYEIHGLIATGGMGAVYNAVQKSLDRTVAIKILPSELSSDEAFCAGFEAEAKAMARLNHPNLIGVYDFGEVNDMLFIIMEFVAGQSIYHSAYGTTIHPKEVIRLVTGICDGLSHAHENGIIHRDIKPSNILLDLNGNPKIGDFGLARPVDWKLKAGEEIFGTPHYTAPEVVSDPYSVDHRADIFSLGVMLHELLTGKLPANDPRPASAIVRCDTRLDAIIRRATQNFPASRYPSAAEMAADLRAIRSSQVPSTVNAPSGRNVPAGRKTAPMPTSRAAKVPRKFPKARKKSANNSALLFVLLVVLAGAAYYHFSGNPQTAVIAPTTPTPAPVKPMIEVVSPPPEENSLMTPDPTIEEALDPATPTLDPVEPETPLPTDPSDPLR